MVRGSYNFTVDGLLRARACGVTTGEVWTLVMGRERVVVTLKEGLRMILGPGIGRNIAVLVREVPDEDDVWDITAARSATPAEDRAIAQLRRM